jgi:ribosome-associated translation inhibitor RaiA
MTTSIPDDVVQVHVAGPVLPADVAYARSKLTSVPHYSIRPVLSMRIKLTRLPDPALARPALAQVNVDVDGRFVRAQAARPTMHEAIDEVHDRVRDRLQRATHNWEAIRGAAPLNEPHEWRHDSVPSERPQFYPRPADERQVVRHKALALPATTVDEAAVDMELLDYDFLLFREVGSGVDSVLYRSSDGGGYRLSQLEPRPDRVVRGATEFTMSAHEPPCLSVEGATERLNVSGWPFVFFRDAATGRGSVLYHRYDGHYGVIQPADNR